MLNLIEVVKKSIRDAEVEKSFLDQSVLDIDGMSSNKIRHFLNNLCNNMSDTRYLEIGTWKGSTLISAAYKNVGTFIGVDNFQHFGSPKEEFYRNKKLFYEFARISFFEENCWELDMDLIPLINIFFYDGAHDFESQKKAFLHFDKILDQEFIAVIDDWNKPKVQKSTNIVFKELKYNIEYSCERLTKNQNGDPDDFWNGIYAAVISK